MTEFTSKDQKVAFPMAELRAIFNVIRPLGYSVRGGKDAVSGLSGASRSAFATGLWQVAIKPEAIVLLAINEAIDRLGTDAHEADAIAQQPAGNLLR